MEEKYAVNVNVEEIMKDIRSKIQKDLAELPDFEDIPIRESDTNCIDWGRLDNARAYINDKSYIPYYYDFSGNPIVVLIKKIVRKFAVCVIDPILDRQNRLNSNISECINVLSQAIDKAYDNSEKTEAELTELKGKTIYLTNVIRDKEIEIKRLSTRLDELEKKVSSLDVNQSGRK